MQSRVQINSIRKNKNKKVKGAIKYYKYYNCLSLVPPWLANENLQLSLSKIQENAFLMLTWNAYLLEIDLKIYIYILLCLKVESCTIIMRYFS